jgi:hypothetical protein
MTEQLSYNQKRCHGGGARWIVISTRLNFNPAVVFKTPECIFWVNLFPFEICHVQFAQCMSDYQHEKEIVSYYETCLRPERETGPYVVTSFEDL